MRSRTAMPFTPATPARRSSWPFAPGLPQRLPRPHSKPRSAPHPCRTRTRFHGISLSPGACSPSRCCWAPPRPARLARPLCLVLGRHRGGGHRTAPGGRRRPPAPARDLGGRGRVTPFECRSKQRFFGAGRGLAVRDNRFMTRHHAPRYQRPDRRSPASFLEEDLASRSEEGAPDAGSPPAFLEREVGDQGASSLAP